ncbi:adenylyl-sulfate kinase [Paenibacillus tritici]|uniref:adenylyl-sulfate kinase n=1 Tax=Paenibacillus tritici TaxID=1873425 RepID=UPI001BAE1F8B|nr:adenylyl-sulfate kinase [Paenibacillus tritici]QUL52225.1 adenylyl-sulfate kinase [Paenibacillus tritici]
MSSQNANVIWHHNETRQADRQRLTGQSGMVVWLTGLSGAGKSTISGSLEKKLIDSNRLVYVLDGDNLRHGLNQNLGFTQADRNENVRRIIEVADLFRDAGLITIVSCISPYAVMREVARQRIGDAHYIEVYVKADLDTCIQRDPKKLYEKALKGIIGHFTGISDPYEEPQQPDIVLDTNLLSVEESSDALFKYIMLWQEKRETDE